MGDRNILGQQNIEFALPGLFDDFMTHGLSPAILAAIHFPIPGVSVVGSNVHSSPKS